MGHVSREGGNLVLSSTVDVPLESKDNVYYTTDVYYTMTWMPRAVIGCTHDLLEYRAIQHTGMTSQETCFFVLFNIWHTVLKCLWDYLTISHRRQHEYQRIVTETKSRWLFADIHVTWGDLNCFSIILHWWWWWLYYYYWSISNSKTSTNLAAILKTASLQCNNHCTVIIAGWSEAPTQSQLSIFSIVIDVIILIWTKAS